MKKELKTSKTTSSNKKKRRWKKKTIWIMGGSFLILLLGIILVLFLLHPWKGKKKEEDTSDYWYLGDTMELGSYQNYSYANPFYLVQNHEKYAFMDASGQLKTEFIYDAIEPLGNLFLVYGSEELFLLNQNLETIFEDVVFEATTYCDDQYYILYQNDGYILIDADGKILLEGYDEIFCQNGYVVARKNNQDEIYDASFQLILKDVYVAELSVDDAYRHAINDHFILLKKDNQYQIYYLDTKRLSSLYEFATIRGDYVAYTEQKKVNVADSKGKIVTTFDKEYKDYELITKDILAVPNRDCQSEEWYADYRSLYHAKEGELSKGICNEVKTYQQSTIVKTPDNHYTVYDDNQMLFEYQGEENSELVENEYFQFAYYWGNLQNLLLNRSGSRVYSECAYGVTQLSEELYGCSPTRGLSYAYYQDKALLPSAYASLEVIDDRFLLVQTVQNTYGLYDLKGNSLLEEKYDTIQIMDGVVMIQYQGKNYAKEIQKGKKEDLQNYLKKEHDIPSSKEEDVPDDFELDLPKFLANYQLEDKQQQLEEHEELVRKVVYHAQENSHMSEDDRKYLYSLFDVIIDYATYMDIHPFLEKLDTLKITVYDQKTDNMRDFSAGEYHSYDNSIHILKWEYDYVIRHELMHFISFANQSYEDVYYCTTGPQRKDEVQKLSFEEQTKCDVYDIDQNSTFLEEGGAEYFTRVVDQNEHYRSYPTTNIAYNLLQYILEDDFKQVQYSSSKAFTVSKLLHDKLGYQQHQIQSLLEALQQLNQVELEIAYIRYHVADELIKAYMAKKIGDWKDNPYVAYSIYMIVMPSEYQKNLDAYLKENPNSSITYYRDYQKLNYKKYGNTLLKEVGKNVSYTLDPYFMNEQNRFKVFFITYEEEGICDISIYFDEQGKVIDTKVVYE